MNIYLKFASIAFASALSGAAAAQDVTGERVFKCGNLGMLTIRVVNPTTIRVADTNGLDLILKEIPGKHWHFRNGDNQVTIASDQRSLELRSPAVGNMHCKWEPGMG